jgi:hypothetical protein
MDTKKETGREKLNQQIEELMVLQRMNQERRFDISKSDVIDLAVRSYHYGWGDEELDSEIDENVSDFFELDFVETVIGKLEEIRKTLDWMCIEFNYQAKMNFSYKYDRDSDEVIFYFNTDDLDKVLDKFEIN